MDGPSPRTDREWTELAATLCLQRAQPVLVHLDSVLFSRVDLSAAFALIQIELTPDTPFRSAIWPRLASAIGPDADAVLQWMKSFPADDMATRPAAHFWRDVITDLKGPYAPAFQHDAQRALWDAFLLAYRGRAGEIVAPNRRVPDWVRAIQSDADFARRIRLVIDRQRKSPLSERDRRIYTRFGWNDDGDSPGLTLLSEGVALERLRRAWRVASTRFDLRDQAVIADAALRLVTDQAGEALEASKDRIEAAAIGYEVPPAELADRFFTAPSTAPPLANILLE